MLSNLKLLRFKKKKVFFDLAISFFSIIISAILLEIFLAKFLPQKTFNLLYKNSSHCYASDSQTPFILKPNCTFNFKNEDFDVPIKINSLGFRGEEVEFPKAGDATRIIVTGDSFVLGYGIPDGNKRSAKKTE